MVRIAIIGCGIVGASIAFELSKFPELKVTVFDKQPPVQGSTGAALGVLMGVISHKTKGRNWHLRETSLQRYETLIPELEAATGRKIPFNKQGILLLCSEGEDLSKWEKLAATRKSQGWKLELWEVEQVREFCPHLDLNHNIIAGIYSPQDRQVDPTTLTLALVDAAKLNGVNFQFGVEVQGIKSGQDACSTTNSLSCGTGILPVTENSTNPTINLISCGTGILPVTEKFDRLIVSAGLGTAAVTASLNQLVDIRPVLGQALHLRSKNPLGNPDFAPVITCDDVHIVPLANQECWVGATVEFPENGGEVQANADMLDEVMARAIALCPALAEAEIIRKWSGLRPRPEGRPAPIIEALPSNSKVLIASGHYRNGVLLAPATARSIREMILQ
ncbi:FAD-dependent oxidoreductase [Microcoleus sp. PH2017_05_CCC_O_A]|uniref:NAD(P)/FAD-dependent oxidoreductase n=1 Tax=Microcoleus sp. PH2017_05_CCC_O_A TaxID=2798816 RepID=UPI001DD91287|nr:FAD-dependent oxidoreductase [Microcoleus sp. PH2017_05_CCC_O_A]MCC3434047.1 FAD-binding oxidoreductase [Microcoleus sp. PH2017_05_CCC_O_A]MCC3465498.1 FAD-binding oxidoreductase [Microcoleus sp. PH2017_06_SFM_O_A]TAH28756.1 MAG: FAD-binding oxidoreductase [Oscillatoriales cyanobacterium]